MTGCNTWSYRPYRPLLTDVGDPYICRVAPGAREIELEWLNDGGQSCGVYYRRRGQGEFLLSGTTRHNRWVISGLEDGQDYELYVSRGDGRSRVRLARTGAVFGTVVNYLHPEDEAYAFSGRYLCSPSMVRHPEGYLLASMDLYAHEAPQNLTLIYRSDDDGRSWHYVSELMPCFWGKLFIHKGDVYMLACSTEYGDLLIGRSTDGGRTFGAPVTLLRGSGGKLGNTGVHKNPQNIVVYDGRLYETLEWGSWQNHDYTHASMVMFCGVDEDLLRPENWHFSQPVKYDPNWPGTVRGEARGVLEGTLCVNPAGALMALYRYDITWGQPPYGLVLAFRINTRDPDAPMEYSHSVEMPCNMSKFSIKRDSVSGCYYSIVTRIDCPERIRRRNLLSLMRSPDLVHWELVRDLVDWRQEDMEKVGLQYVDFEFEREDIIYLCRTAWNGAHNFHDANYSVFHRVSQFRRL